VPEGEPATEPHAERISMWIDDFVECLNGAFKDDVHFEKAVLIKHQHLPRFIYKYRNYNDYSIGNLETDTVWMTSASSYNDPYDSAITISFRRLNASSIKFNAAKMPYLNKLRKFLTEDEFNAGLKSDDPIESFTRMFLEKDKAKPPEKIPQMLEALGKAIERVNRPMLEAMRKDIQNKMVLCSFSGVPDSIIMWGHYARDHKGFCIEYEVKELDDVRQRLLFPVIYSNKLFDATKYFEAAIKDIARFNNVFATLAALYKSPEWTYEQEWRLGRALINAKPQSY
jgi:Protein of unknown function (DUF2971)